MAPLNRVHILFQGAALCGLPGLPSDWPAGNQWVGLPELEHGSAHVQDVTCDLCSTAWFRRRLGPIMDKLATAADVEEGKRAFDRENDS